MNALSMVCIFLWAGNLMFFSFVTFAAWHASGKNWSSADASWGLISTFLLFFGGILGFLCAWRMF